MEYISLLKITILLLYCTDSTVLYCKVQYDNETVDYSHVICLFIGFGVKESNSASKTTIL